MRPDRHTLSRSAPWLGAALLALAACCTTYAYPSRDHVLVTLMLGLPLLDRAWRPPALPRNAPNATVWAALIIAGVALLHAQPQYLPLLPTMLILTALPEEWFFRAWFQTRVGTGHKAILLASLLFSLIHGLTRGWLTGTLVFLPALAYGWLYQRTRDLPLLVLVHLLSNLVYAAYIGPTMEPWLGRVFG